MEKLCRPLQWGWSLKKYTGGKRPRPREDDSAKRYLLDLDEVDAGIRCSVFWNFITMLAHLSECLHSLMVFAESCPCHTAPFLVAHDRDFSKFKKLNEAWADALGEDT